jgi:hypothetical protein
MSPPPRPLDLGTGAAAGGRPGDLDSASTTPLDGRTPRPPPVNAEQMSVRTCAHSDSGSRAASSWSTGTAAAAPPPRSCVKRVDPPRRSSSRDLATTAATGSSSRATPGGRSRHRGARRRRGPTWDTDAAANWERFAHEYVTLITARAWRHQGARARDRAGGVVDALLGTGTGRLREPIRLGCLLVCAAGGSGAHPGDRHADRGRPDQRGPVRSRGTGDGDDHVPSARWPACSRDAVPRWRAASSSRRSGSHPTRIGDEWRLDRSCAGLREVLFVAAGPRARRAGIPPGRGAEGPGATIEARSVAPRGCTRDLPSCASARRRVSTPNPPRPRGRRIGRAPTRGHHRRARACIRAGDRVRTRPRFGRLAALDALATFSGTGPLIVGDGRFVSG